MNKLKVMDPSKGHVVTEYAPPEVKTKEAEKTREEAEKIFNAVMERGMTVFAFDGPQAEGTQIKKFDPAVKEMIAIPQIVGG